MNEGEVIILLHMLLQQMKAPEDQKTIDNIITDILENAIPKLQEKYHIFPGEEK